MDGNIRRSSCPLRGLAVGIIGLIALGNSLLFAQSFTATITGTVRDATGAVVPDAGVTAKHLDTGLTRTVQADTGGAFNLPLLPVGAYEVTAEKMGFRKEVRNGINLAVAQQ